MRCSTRTRHGLSPLAAERDADGIVWLTFDKAGESTNTFSQEVMEELGRIVDRLATERPKGLVIRSGKASGFIAGADVEEFTQIESVEDALGIVRRGWETFSGSPPCRSRPRRSSKASAWAAAWSSRSPAATGSRSTSPGRGLRCPRSCSASCPAGAG